MKNRRASYWLSILIAALCWSLQGQAQTAPFDALQPGYITLGLNGGLSFQSSDVQARFNGYGAGLTLAKNLYYHPASPFTFDIRGRFLYARQYGLDGIRSSQIDRNIALNGQLGLNYLDYPAALGVTEGFVYQNYRTTLGELAAEAVGTWHTNRLGPGLFVSLYGGLGLYGFQTRIDQTNALGEPYYEAYAQAEGSKGQIRRDLLNNVLDGNYETVADRLSGSGSGGIAPSLGLEAGIQLTPYFALSLGHRVTFSGNNLLDGHQWEDDRGDWYHYTNLGLKWTFNRGKRAPRGRKPDISITYPSPLPFYANSSNGLVKARITGVERASDITCTVNGLTLPFDYYGGNFSVSFPLTPGRNTVNIQASNPHGRDLATAVIYFQTGGGINPGPPPNPNPNPTPVPPPPPPPPQPDPQPWVEITQPAANPATSSSPSTTIRATVRYVASSNDIRFAVNGRRLSNFSFSGNTFQANISLEPGNNTVELEGRNNSGTAKDAVTIVYNQPGQAPVVTIQQPADATSTTQKPTASIRATVKGVTQASDVTYLVNGKKVTNFDFNPGTGTFSHLLPLSAGANDIVLKGTNAYGSDQASVRIVYQAPGPPPQPPVVTIQEPADRTRTQKTTLAFKATARYVKTKQDIRLEINGKATGNFTFNASNGQVAATLPLALGNNQVRITGTNVDGSDEASVLIIREEVAPPPPPAPPKPSISFVQPAVPGQKEDKTTFDVKATLLHVEDSKGITFRVNGKAISGFLFRNGQFSARIELAEGRNDLEIVAVNEAGEARAQSHVVYRKPTGIAKGDKPVVTITSISQPASNPLNPNVASSVLKATIRNVQRPQNVTLTINGKAVTGFDFDPGTGSFSATLLLERGSNLIVLKAVNRAGAAQEERTIDF